MTINEEDLVFGSSIGEQGERFLHIYYSINGQEQSTFIEIDTIRRIIDFLESEAINHG